MIRGLVVLAVLLAGLVAWDASLRGERARVREESGRLRPLLDDAAKEGMIVAAVRVETAAGEDFLYARTKGVWKLIEPPVGTWARPSAIEALMKSVVEAKGVVLSRDKLRAEDYGFGTDIAIRVTFHGTKLRTAEDGDVLYCLDLGYPIQGTEGAYVRPLGTHEVWAVDQNPREALARPPGSGFPPMLDPHVIPEVAAASFGGIARIELSRRDGPGFTLEARPRAPETVQEGEAAIEWVLTRPNGESEPCEPAPPAAWSMFLLRTPYEKILGASELDPGVLEDPDARLTLQPAAGPPLSLLFGPPDRTGASVVVNEGTQTVFEVSADVRELVLPAAETVTTVEGGVPWHELLQTNPMVPGAPGVDGLGGFPR